MFFCIRVLYYDAKEDHSLRLSLDSSPLDSAFNIRNNDESRELSSFIPIFLYLLPIFCIGIKEEDRRLISFLDSKRPCV